jgi:hypothetical protein
VAFVVLQVSVALAPPVTLVGLAVSVTVGAAGGGGVVAGSLSEPHAQSVSAAASVTAARRNAGARKMTRNVADCATRSLWCVQ